MIELTDEQDQIIQELFDFYKNGNGYVTIGGYAGTGKTYLIAQFKKFLIDNDYTVRSKGVAFCCPTGKASSVLKKKLEESKSFNEYTDFCGTIHKLMYYPIIDKNDKVIKGWHRKEKIGDYALIVIDEASMLDKKMFDDLKSYRVPIILIGDHGQLFPISNDGFSIMKNPDFKLTKIHRQADGNPIIDISKKIRESGIADYGYYSNTVFKVSPEDNVARHIMENTDFMDKNIIMLTNSNKDRKSMNEFVRMKNNYDNDILYPGEKIVCLNNNYNYGCMNGELYTIMWVMDYNKELYELVVKKEGEEDLLSILAYKKSFGLESYNSLHDDCNKLRHQYYKQSKKYKEVITKDFVCFDFGYSMTVHKAQGSSWEKVILFERRNKYQNEENFKRWLYTGVTRAEKSLLIITGSYFT